jgi:glycosyltransferase involved in cell wall biosynthesis
MSVATLCEQLASSGIAIEAYATTANGKEELPVSPGKTVNVDGVRVTYFKRVTGDHTHFSPALIGKLWKNAKKFDMVHIHAWWNTVSIFSCLVALLRGVPVVVSPRGTLSGYSFNNRNIGAKWMIHQFLGKALLKRCHFHVTSQQEAKVIRANFNPLSINTIANFVVLPDEPSTQSHEKRDIFRLAFFSRIEEKKGLNLLISALPDLNIPYKLTIAGNGESSYIGKLKELSAANGSEPNISWVGFLRDEKFEFLAVQDLLVLPSHDENFANVVIETLSEGTATLLSEFVGLVDYVVNNSLGWVCKLQPKLIAEKINAIALQPEELKRIKMVAPGQIRQDFNKDRLTCEYLNMYDKILSGKRN